MVSSENIEKLKQLAARSCMICETDKAFSLSRMLGWSKSQGKHLRPSIHQRVRAVIDAVFEGDSTLLSAAKEALFNDIKRVQPFRDEKPLYKNDEEIQSLTDQIALNVTRFTDHLRKLEGSEVASNHMSPGTAIDSSSASFEGRSSGLFTLEHPRIPPTSSLRGRKR